MTNSNQNNGFFAVDVRCFAEACADVNMATAYLVMARGTGGDNVTTAWSVNAIEKHTNMSRNRAKAAIERLIEKRLVLKVAGGARPRYKLASWAQIQGLAPDPTPLTEEQTAVLEIVRQYGSLSAKQKRVAHALVHLRRVRWENGYPREIVPPEPRLSFIPNAFVSGADGETPPLERLRTLHDAGLFRLVVDLYRVHLEDDGGIAKTVIYRDYHREIKAEVGPFRIMEFRLKGLRAYPQNETLAPHVDQDGKAPMVWRRFEALQDTGLIEWIPTLFEASACEAEPIVPLGIDGSDMIEDRLGKTAHTAAAVLLSRHWVLDQIPKQLEGPTHDFQLVPVPRRFSEATLIGVARLRYRPLTKRTSEWRSRIEERSEEHLNSWMAIIESTKHAKREAA